VPAALTTPLPRVHPAYACAAALDQTPLPRLLRLFARGQIPTTPVFLLTCLGATRQRRDGRRYRLLLISGCLSTSSAAVFTALPGADMDRTGDDTVARHYRRLVALVPVTPHGDAAPWTWRYFPNAPALCGAGLGGVRYILSAPNPTLWYGAPHRRNSWRYKRAVR